jgi:hypothetical protein
MEYNNGYKMFAPLFTLLVETLLTENFAYQLFEAEDFEKLSLTLPVPMEEFFAIELSYFDTPVPSGKLKATISFVDTTGLGNAEFKLKTFVGMIELCPSLRPSSQELGQWYESTRNLSLWLAHEFCHFIAHYELYQTLRSQVADCYHVFTQYAFKADHYHSISNKIIVTKTLYDMEKEALEFLRDFDDAHFQIHDDRTNYEALYRKFEKHVEEMCLAKAVEFRIKQLKEEKREP